MKNIIRISFIALFIFTANFAQSQETTTPEDSTQNSDTTEIFVFVEDHPQFPGGEKARRNFLASNIKYPEIAIQKNIQGTVFISFVIEKDGSITNVIVRRGVHKSLDNEAIRVVKSMPKWKPGTQRGKPVRVQYNMPIKFVLMDDSEPAKTPTKKELKEEKRRKKKAQKAAQKEININ